MPTSLLRYLCVSAIAGLLGCTTLSKLGYDRPASVESSHSADVTLVSGAITGTNLSASSTRFRFRYRGQLRLALCLMLMIKQSSSHPSSMNLNRLKILSARDATDTVGGKADMSIRVTFLRTHVRDTPVDTYT